jgi:hypothetical protein
MGRKWWQGLIGSKKSETSEGTAEERIRQAAETHAQALNLSNLGLPELPESLGQLTALQRLYLDRNRLSALPEFLGRLNGLYLHDNPHLGLPAEVLGPTWQEVPEKTPASPKSILDFTSAAGRRDRSTRRS